MDERLASLKDQGAERFDRAGWHYLDTLARRTGTLEGRAHQLLAARLEQAASSFALRFDRARASAADLLAAGSTRHPHAAAELQRLFDGGDFAGVRHRLATLDARAQCAPLAGLVAQLEPAAPATVKHAPAPAAVAATPIAVSPALELKTVRESRATWARMSVDKQLSEAMKQAPKNAGPINSHMLILRSLAMMQSISPEYLGHLVSYADTLLLLNPGELEVQPKRARPAAAKTARSTRSAKKA